jgi:hypothetical protein
VLVEAARSCDYFYRSVSAGHVQASVFTPVSQLVCDCASTQKERAVKPAPLQVQLSEVSSAVLDLDFDVDASRQFDALQAVDGLSVRVNDVDQTLVNTHFEMLT